MSKRSQADASERATAERKAAPAVCPVNIDWDQLRIFYAVVEARSFTRAGRALDLSQSAVSRQIGALEKSLQISLFHRHAQGLVLTESGENFHKTVAAMYERMAMGLSQINEYRESPKGPLKLTTSVAFGSGRRVPIAQRWRPWADPRP